ncbi:hypothetical protein UFOVP1290_114 [uncultured Caudovirales phage]|uniref:Uncharacterized protein n=1 Tax=uncultured Caudovirales phage TaxID=2100421 RepID=A0A6J5RX64_9CAUD|nr:hypothetical protein UFOVP1290_114 [uncultured Caudovirales phage]
MSGFQLGVDAAGAESLVDIKTDLDTLVSDEAAEATKMPASLGSKADAASFPVTQSTEDKAVLAAMSAKLPASVGVKANTGSLSVTMSTEDAAKMPASLGSKADAASFPVTQSTEDKAVLSGLTGKFPTAAIPADADANTGAAATVTRIASRLWGYNAATWDAVRTGLNAVQTAFTGMINTIPVGKYNATQPTLADTNGVNLQVDSRGNLRVANMLTAQAQDDLNQVLAVQVRVPIGTTYAPTVFTDRGATVTKLVKGSAGMVVGLTCYNTTASTRFLQLHNLVAAPAAGAPALSFLVPAGAQIVLGTDIFTSAGISFATGIVYGVSSTSDSYTAGSATDCSIQIFYY